MGMSEEAKIAHLEALVEEHGREIRRNTDNIEGLSEKVSNLTLLTESVKAIVEKLNHMCEDVSDIKSSQDEMKEKIYQIENEEGKRAAQFLNSLRDKAVWAVVAALLGFAIAQIFPFTVI